MHGRNDWPVLGIVAEDHKVELGQVVQAYGFPFGTIPDGGNPSITMNQGRISSLSRDDDGALSDIRFDAAVNPGNSGGPLVDEQGRVLGVVKAKIGERTSFAVGFKRLREFLKQPGLSMEAEVPTWDKRGQPMEFRIYVETGFGAIRPDSVEVELSADGKTKQVQSANLPADQDELVIRAAPDPKPNAEPTSLAMSAATPKSIAPARARFKTAGMPARICSVWNPAMPRNFMPSATWLAVNDVVAPSCLAVASSLANWSVLAPVTARTSAILSAKPAKIFTLAAKGAASSVPMPASLAPICRTLPLKAFSFRSAERKPGRPTRESDVRFGGKQGAAQQVTRLPEGERCIGGALMELVV